MLTHIVVWKYRADVPQTTREDHVERLRSLGSIVPGIESLGVGFDTLHLPRSFDTGLAAILAGSKNPRSHSREAKPYRFGAPLPMGIAA